ncbi:MAG: hypothetical protein HZB61_08440 [Nitrospirae bacterium]|nr:hypothetical protein [Nitrospirota bacterium]
MLKRKKIIISCSDRDDNGYILITVLLLLLVLTVVGMTAIGTSTIENMMSGNIKCRERNISKSAGGIGISTGIIQRALGPDGDTKCFSGVIMDPNLPFELLNTSFATDEPDTNPDATLQVDGGNLNIDIDKMYSKWINGTAIEYAAGYEGVGKSGSSGIYAFYRINSNSTECASNTTVGAIYRYVSR